MNENEQFNEIFGGLWKKFVEKQKQFNIQHSQPIEPPASITLPSGRRKKKKSPEQLMLPLKRGRKKQLTLPLKVQPNPGEFSMDKVYTDIAKGLNKVADIRAKEEKKQKDLEKLYRYMRKTGKSMEDLGLSELTSMINEVIAEELAEINHTTDSSGKTIIAQGAPGSVIRFATEHPDIIKQMRDWIKDCQREDLPDEEAVNELSDTEVLQGIQNNYDGGIREFLRNSNSQAQVPVGMKENWSGGQDDDAPDGYSNDYQRAFAHSQVTTPRENQTEKAKQLAKSGKFVILVGHPVYCKATDAVLGISTVIEKVCNTREEAEKELEKYNTAEYSDDYVSIIGPDNVEPKQYKDPNPDEDVPFQEGVGYVHDKDMKKDPKHIPGERWRIKFQSDSDLKKHGNTETSPINEVISKQELKNVIKELVTEMWYGSKNDVEGDETHDEPLNEILGSYDKMIEFVKSLPPEEQEKLNQMSKEMGASAAVIKYLDDLSKQDPKTSMNESSDWNPQPLPQDVHKVAEIIHSLKEGTGVFFSYDNVTGHSSDWIWVECVSDGETISYYMSSKESRGAKTDLEDDNMIDDAAQEVATGGYHFFTIQKIQDYKKPSRQIHHPEDDQDIGDYERYGADQPEPQYESKLNEGNDMNAEFNSTPLPKNVNVLLKIISTMQNELFIIFTHGPIKKGDYLGAMSMDDMGVLEDAVSLEKQTNNRKTTFTYTSQSDTSEHDIVNQTQLIQFLNKIVKSYNYFHIANRGITWEE